MKKDPHHIGLHYIGIDPGQTGAMAIVNQDGQFVEVKDWIDETIAANDLKNWLEQYDIACAALERVSAMPKQGVSSTFKFGVNFGTWRGVLAGLGIGWEEPTPQAWQRGMVKPGDGKDPKSRALTVARRLFPDAPLSRQRDNGRADALLIARWLWAKSRSME